MTQVQPILWLASWYPNRLGPFDGDFIQRHARAEAQKRPVHVLFVKKDLSGKFRGRFVSEIHTHEGITEEVCYYRPLRLGISFVDRLLSFCQYLLVFRKLIERYIRLHGKPPLVHVHVTMRAGLLAYWLRQTRGIPYVITEHWTGFDPNAFQSIYDQSRIVRWITAAVLRRAEMVLPVCKYLGKMMQNLEPQLIYKVLPNVVDTTLFKAELLKNPVHQFIHASSLSYQKNPEAILLAFSKLSPDKKTDWRLTMIGPVSFQLKQLASTLNIQDQIEWTGEISYAAVSQSMQASDTLVMLSRYENLPCVIAEALCCGLSVVSNRVGGIPEMIDSENGILVDEEAELPQALEQVMAERKFNRLQIGRQAAARYNYDKVAVEFERIYLQII